MQKLTHSDLYSLEEYARIRPEFRQKVMAHKKNRRLPIGPHATLYFEDALTMQYQIQEMLRIERIFEPEGIQEELDAYNPLIPDGSNWKATFMLEFPDEQERRAWLKKLLGIEKHVGLQVGDLPVIRPIADEDLEREDEEKTSSVHFLRFELTPEMVQAAQSGAPLRALINHPEYQHEVNPVPEDVRAALVKDLQTGVV